MQSCFLLIRPIALAFYSYSCVHYFFSNTRFYNFSLAIHDFIILFAYTIDIKESLTLFSRIKSIYYSLYNTIFLGHKHIVFAKLPCRSFVKRWFWQKKKWKFSHSSFFDHVWWYTCTWYGVKTILSGHEDIVFKRGHNGFFVRGLTHRPNAKMAAWLTFFCLNLN